MLLGSITLPNRVLYKLGCFGRNHPPCQQEKQKPTMNDPFLDELLKELENYNIKEPKTVLAKAIRIYHGYLFRKNYIIVYTPKIRIDKNVEKDSKR